MTRAWGVEARVLFLEHELVEVASRCPPERATDHDGSECPVAGGPAAAAAAADGDLNSSTPGTPQAPEDVFGSWSAAPAPDGAHVALVSDRGGTPGIWIEGPTPGRAVAVDTASDRVLAVSWSPNGGLLAYWTAAPGSSRNEVWLVRPDGTDRRRVAGEQPSSALLADGAWHGWTADGWLMVTETAGPQYT